MSKARRKSTDARLLDYIGQQKHPKFGKTTGRQRKRIRQKNKSGKGFWL